MAKPKYDPPVSLQPAIYDAWLAENPKMIEAGPVKLEPVPDSVDPDMVFLPSYHVDSEVLPQHYADTLMVFGTSNEFEGFQIRVTPKGFDYLLMGHQRHRSGPFVDQNGNTQTDSPHFNELDLYRRPKDGRPRNRHIVLPELHKGIAPDKFLEVFLDHYNFDDNRVGAVPPAVRESAAQRKIHEYQQ